MEWWGGLWKCSLDKPVHEFSWGSLNAPPPPGHHHHHLWQVICNMLVPGLQYANQIIIHYNSSYKMFLIGLSWHCGLAKDIYHYNYVQIWDYIDKL